MMLCDICLIWLVFVLVVADLVVWCLSRCWVFVIWLVWVVDLRLFGCFDFWCVVCVGVCIVLFCLFDLVF